MDIVFEYHWNKMIFFYHHNFTEKYSPCFEVLFSFCTSHITREYFRFESVPNLLYLMLLKVVKFRIYLKVFVKRTRSGKMVEISLGHEELRKSMPKCFTPRYRGKRRVLIGWWSCKLINYLRDANPSSFTSQVGVSFIEVRFSCISEVHHFNGNPTVV